MSGTRYVAFVLLLLIAGVGRGEDAPASAPKPKTELPKPGADGFIELFNGTDLTGWQGLEGFWSVKDGVIIGAEDKEHKAPQTFLLLAVSKEDPKKFSDFELHWKFKFATPDGNSGVQFRSKMKDEKTSRIGGYQADCDTKAQYTGCIYDEAGVAGGRGVMSKRGDKTVWDAENKRENQPLAETADQLKEQIKIGDWNDCVLTADGNHITYSINGHVTTDLTDQSPKAVQDGIIGLQLHAGFVMEIQFKDIRIKFLDAAKG